MLLIRAAAALALLPGCLLFGGDPELPTCELGAAAIAPVASSPTGALAAVTDGGGVPLIGAPQGGFILGIGARVEMPSPAGCQVTINAALRDPTSGRVVGFEQRPMRLGTRPDGWAWPPDPADLADVANVPVCPASTSTADIHDHPYQLEVKLLDAHEDVVASSTLMIVPTCDSAYCRDECALHR